MILIFVLGLQTFFLVSKEDIFYALLTIWKHLLCVCDCFGTDPNWLRIAPISFAERFRLTESGDCGTVAIGRSYDALTVPVIPLSAVTPVLNAVGAFSIL